MEIRKRLVLTVILISSLLVPPANAIEAGDGTEKIQQTEAPVIRVKKGSVLELNDCIALALNNSPSIKTAQYNYLVSKTSVNLARSEFFPTIGVGAGYNFTNNHQSRFSADTNAYNLNATLNMLLFDFGKTYARIKMEKFYQIADEYNFYNAVREVTFDVKQKYYQVLAARASVLINQSYVDINERNYLRTKAYYDEGLKSKIDLVNAEVTLSDSKIGLVQSENTYQKSLVNLNNAMYLTDAPNYEIKAPEGFMISDSVAPMDLSHFGKTSSKETNELPKQVSDAKFTTTVSQTEVLTNYKTEKFPYSFDECLKIAKKHRADLKAYGLTVDALKENLLYIKRNYYPSVSANAGYTLRDTSHNPTANTIIAGVNLSSSLNIMAQKNQIDAGKYQIDIAQTAYDQLDKDIFFQVQNAYINMIQLEKQIPLQGVKVRQTKENYELAEGRYYVGLGDYIELQDAKVNYNNAQQSYINTIYNYNVARAALESVIALPQRVTKTLEGKTNGKKK